MHLSCPAEIPEIPSLDVPAAEDLTAQVSQAPASQIRVTTMADLDRDLVSTLPFSQTVRCHIA